MADIFISYAREDAAIAGSLAAALEGRGWSVFWDRRIPAGSRFADVIAHHVSLARCVIALWSKAANESDWVLEEAEEGRKRNILTPARIEEVEPPWGFRRINAANLIGWKGEREHAGFKQLMEDIVASIGDGGSHVPVSSGSTAFLSPINSSAATSGSETVDERSTEEIGRTQGAIVGAKEQGQGSLVEASPSPLKLGARMFEQLKLGIQALQPAASWGLYAGKSYEGWWFLTDSSGEQLIRVKPMTNLLRVRIRAWSSGGQAGRVNHGGWILEDESSVARNENDVARILDQIRAEWR